MYRAIDQQGQVIDAYVSKRRNITAARHFFATALTNHGRPAEVTTDLAAPLLSVVDELIPGHAFIQNLRRGHYELGVDADRACLRLAAAFDIR